MGILVEDLQEKILVACRKYERVMSIVSVLDRQRLICGYSPQSVNVRKDNLCDEFTSQ